MSKLHPQTGPVTVAGKETSSQNATTHGGTSEKLIVGDEKKSDFDRLLNDLLEEYAPATEQARLLVEDAALARWYLWRRQRTCNKIEAALYEAQPAPELWTAEQFHQLALADRYKTAAERSLQRALRNLEGHLRQAAQLKKTEAQAEVAVARAADFLDARDESQWQAAHKDFDCPTLVQEITVRRTQNYGAITEMSPTNAAMLRQLDRPSSYPAERVCRKFHFPHGMPAEYHSFTSREDYRREKGHTIDQSLSLAVFREIVKAEQARGTGHALPNPEGHSVS